MSGWLLMTGEDDDETGGIYRLGQVLQHDPSIARYLDRPVPCMLVRDEIGDGFHEVPYDDDDDDDDDIDNVTNGLTTTLDPTSQESTSPRIREDSIRSGSTSLAPFIQFGSGVHPILDCRDLLAFYRDLREPLGCISSPSDLVRWETLRERYDFFARSKSVPCDLFVWAKGAPPDQRLTRVGGTPWLPKSVPWPVIGGVIPSFLCQFDFRDSFDLVRSLPGDLLLVFVANEDCLLGGDEELMRFLWVSADDVEVISESDVPTPTYPFEHVRAWGVRHRTADFPGCWDRAFELPDDGAWQLPVLWGTKIGGVPYHSQTNLDAVPADFLCQLVSIQPSPNVMWPWADEESPLSLDFKEGGIYFDQNQLMIGDMGELTFYLRSDGSVGVDSACA